MTSSTAQAKARARRQARQGWASLDPGRTAAWSQRIASHVVGLAAWGRLGVLHTYVDALPNEVRTRPLIEAALARGARVVVPVVAGRAQPLRHAEIGSLDELARSEWGLWQPARPRWAEGQVDLVLVPGLLFDRRGYRIGQGGGYYDRFLVGLAGVPTVGLVYGQFLVERVPTAGHDVPVGLVVTESGVHTPEPHGRAT